MCTFSACAQCLCELFDIISVYFCQPGLHIPRDCQLIVDGISLQWTEGQMLCFDETYLHAAQHDGSQTFGDARVILIIDLWHPDLDAEQRSLIDYAFSPVAGNSHL